MAPQIVANIDGHIFRKVTGFYEKYFEGKVPPSTISSVMQHSPLSQFNKSSSKYDKNVEERQLVPWFDNALPGSGSKWKYEWHAEVKATTMELVQIPNIEQPQNGVSFTRAIGVQANTGTQSYRNSFEQLCVMAGLVFEREPLRFALHGFLINGKDFEAWIFDSAGAYSCTPFEIGSDLERFVSIMCAYKLLSEDQLGCNTFVQHVSDTYTVFHNRSEENTGPSPLFLSLPPITNGGAEHLVSGGPSVYSASSTPLKKGEYVVKFKWRKDFEPSEGALLEKLKKSQLYGLLQLYHQEEVLSTSTLREYLGFGQPLQLTSVDETPQGNEGSILNADLCFVEAVDKPNMRRGYIDRYLSCIAVYPKGLELEDYSTAVQAIGGFRDALHGHRSLYQKASMLHRDVSIFNIMLTDRSSTIDSNAPQGFLIDIDGAIDLEDPPQRNQIVGTMPFMAIELLKGQLPHTYRYDLESFLYCLVWFCISPRSTTIRPPEGSGLWRWRVHDDEELVQIKLQDMRPESFERLLKEFDPDFQHCRTLAEGLRGLLFPLQPDGTLDIKTDETDQGTNALYDRMIELFDDCIKTLSRL